MRPSSRPVLLAAALAIGAAGIAALPASAAPRPAAAAVLTTGDATGEAVAAGDVLAAPLAATTRATFYSAATSTTGVTCGTSQFTATVLTNPAAPGTATESLTGMAFGSCTSNVTGVTAVKSLTVGNLPYTVAVDDSAGYPVTLTAGTAGPIQATAVLSTWFGTITCSYQLSGAFTGTADNTAHSLAFRNEHFAKSGGSGLCPADGYFSATYGPVTDTGRPGSPVVHIN
ncbi:Tat pathway signal sequence domain protein [Kitasatospora sp. DSM 101779]|uniref:Tat pathway signal sequence domain protein n=1 Tax=Kitasatospora sp. DSM 101779 TaxID=2853165 RepID=UPI0021DA4CCF|nr:Tat pathway signal sequence domain protein [Kitasatospora sp. DSM 101779]MCU7821409.1 Tat pathway signal sequence domain protein [Kitasatospora sp. DSM 101779]